ncbi:hypothetical protein DSM104443_02791 [Usitatibacter rugosus]|uniref:Uncharacterized protein n=1 Tax=Usitatibacter rugosus TaxID=2732067 RepID=A0A6M4GWS3_9PROT|nr:methyltransferase domain-containing protein [Usitatibacter rugosus]QJR11709.1 hypothetical protein DSM104443_02791 [Usitatibacter rugosus]
MQIAIAAIIRNRSWHLNRQRIRSKDYLDVGCGNNCHPNFINLDFSWHPGIDICWDITRPLPLESQSVRGIYTEHCLEHVPLEAGDRLLGEFRRILKPGGSLRIVVPDGSLYLNNYASDLPLPYAAEDSYRGIYTPMMSVNRIMRKYGHAFIYDFATLRRLLESHGFRSIAKEGFLTGRDPSLLIDSQWRAIESLYVEASTEN